ncbi:immunity protein Imm33 domain-containing protein [Pseudoduganella sp. S-14]|uniref:immunity protein Imm33 domain-containing protein n=1 Tax=Pseudoduganella sp. S-14 TaxID=3404065 RepID=UPI003CF19860
MEVTKANIGGRVIAIKAAIALKGQVDWLISLLHDMHSQGSALSDGQRLQLGFSVLTARQGMDGEISLWEPDFDRNPFEDLREGVNVTMALLAQQTGFVRRARAQPTGISFQDKIVLTRGALQAGSIYLERSAPDPGKQDSGWFIGLRGNDSCEELEAIFAFQLLHQRPTLLAVLALPPGFMVFVEGEEIVGVANERNEPVNMYLAPDAAGLS